VITSDGGLLIYRELGDTLGPTDTGAETHGWLIYVKAGGAI
jgi:hypothetical protein